MGEDLFWAIKGGGGGSFGVIISYILKLVSVPEIVTVFRVERTLEENATAVVLKWQQVAPTTDDGLFMRMLLQPVTSKVKKGEKTVRISILAEFLGNADQLVSLLGKEFPELGLKKNSLLNRNPNDANFLKRKSDYVQTPISKDGLAWLWKKMIELGKTGELVQNSVLSELGRCRRGFREELSHTKQKALQLHDPFVSKNPRSAFLNYRDLDIGVNTFGDNSYEEGKVYGLKYFNDNFDRLLKVKTAVDPENSSGTSRVSLLFQKLLTLVADIADGNSDANSGSSSNLPMGDLFVLLICLLIGGW
ncbi:hypothetical protein L3X38_022202 [Prunus dulcis]|uniref:Berberine/berberine-like domain-containing protein n=1 Tax=Prunus dulcis TaxID=3755 RepID=A0AAD4VX42_PRUDU|nr:hypothetical protein L3X38_022202 [Prunus dulcis]